MPHQRVHDVGAAKDQDILTGQTLELENFPATFPLISVELFHSRWPFEGRRDDVLVQRHKLRRSYPSHRNLLFPTLHLTRLPTAIFACVPRLPTARSSSRTSQAAPGR